MLSDGAVNLRASTLYAALDRLTGDGMVEIDRKEAVAGRLRRYYRLTDKGSAVLAMAAARVAAGRARRLDAQRLVRAAPRPPARQPQANGSNGFRSWDGRLGAANPLEPRRYRLLADLDRRAHARLDRLLLHPFPRPGHSRDTAAGARATDRRLGTAQRCLTWISAISLWRSGIAGASFKLD